jgi:hypothetical protein
MVFMDVAVGDYVWATRWSDRDPNDPWAVGFVEALDDDRVLVEGRYWPCFQKINEEQGRAILRTYPLIEKGI